MNNQIMKLKKRGDEIKKKSFMNFELLPILTDYEIKKKGG